MRIFRRRSHKKHKRHKKNLLFCASCAFCGSFSLRFRSLGFATLYLLFWLPEIGVDVTGTHLHKIDEAPTGVGGRLLLNVNRGNALDLEVTRYPGKTSALIGLKSGVRLDRFGIFGKARAGMWHINRAYFAADIGGVLEYYPSLHTAIRIDAGDTILFYGGAALGTVHNFQPGIGFSYRF